MSESANEILYHERIADPLFRTAVDLMDTGDIDNLIAHLKRYPQLVNQRERLGTDDYFDAPSLLEFVAENPIRHGQVQAVAVDVARAIIDAGADADSVNATLGLVCSGRIVRESGQQIPLVNLLCESGARPDQAMEGALGHGEFAAVDALIERGATMSLPIAAATGRTDLVKSSLADAGAGDRQLALAYASQYGHLDVVTSLLKAGVSPDGFNPDGAHGHSTPLHQAALGGHIDVVRTLVEHGARTDLQDKFHNATARDWAAHGGDADTIEFLQQVENKR